MIYDQSINTVCNSGDCFGVASSPNKNFSYISSLKDSKANYVHITLNNTIYKAHVNNASIYNTPPGYSIYICWLVFQWLQKASILYEFLDGFSMLKATSPVRFEIFNGCCIWGWRQKQKQLIYLSCSRNVRICIVQKCLVNLKKKLSLAFSIWAIIRKKA